jgi:hypothetical protein
MGNTGQWRESGVKGGSVSWMSNSASTCTGWARVMGSLERKVGGEEVGTSVSIAALVRKDD